MTIVDLAGRVVRRGWIDGTLPGFEWDGRDQSGRNVRPGIYLVRCEGKAGTANGRVVRIE
ncbi:MAG: hypothetical protein A2V63_08250 [Candidatus Eisenbacteria bacterium RBG_19FT_COMBO_70_11]|nr:MAG: hypothetical protein A2V63_08250 [Candidatus Eisenbacteria bacterium RBG_19FT_COMBO_70_11]